MRFLERSGCHLCDDAWDVVAQAAPAAVSGIERVDIDDHDDLVRDYGLRIPVLLDDVGQVLAEGVFDPREVRRMLRRRRRPSDT